MKFEENIGSEEIKLRQRIKKMQDEQGLKDIHFDLDEEKWSKLTKEERSKCINNILDAMENAKPISPIDDSRGKKLMANNVEVF